MSEPGWYTGWHRDDYSLQDARASVGPGWRALAEAGWHVVREHGGRVVQVKEKFGGLRIYSADVKDWRTVMDRLGPLAERSLETCEACGRWGEPRTREYGKSLSSPRAEGGGVWWIKTLCDRCAYRYYALGERDWSRVSGRWTLEG